MCLKTRVTYIGMEGVKLNYMPKNKKDVKLVIIAIADTTDRLFKSIFQYF
jgi:hypothetical protein